MNFKKIAIYTFSISVVGLLLLILLANFFEKPIKTKIAKELEQYIKTELTVGDINFTLLKNFPQATVVFKNVRLKDIFNSKTPLLQAQSLSFSFGIWSLFGSNINIKSIALEDGTLFFRVNERGQGNYEVFKASGTKKNKENDLSFSIEEAILDDIKINYKDDKSVHSVSLFINNAVSSGNFSKQKFDFKSSAVLKNELIRWEGVEFLKNKNISYDVAISVDLSKNRYDIQKGEVKLEGNAFSVQGTVINATKPNFDLRLGGTDCNLATTLQLLPNKYAEYFGDFQSSGNFSIEGTINGNLGKDGEMPTINMALSLRDGKISSPKLEDALKNVNLKAKFAMQNNLKNAVFELSEFSGNFIGQALKMNLSVHNLDNPFINFGLNGHLPLASTYGLFNNPIITNGDGDIWIKDLNISGLYKDMLSMNTISNIQAIGEVVANNAFLEINKEKITIPEGNLSIDGNKLNINALKISGAGTNAIVLGNFSNLLPVLLASNDNPNHVALIFHAKLNASDLDIDRILNIFSVGVAKEDVNKVVYDSLRVANNIKKEQVTNLLSGIFEANVGKFNYNKIEGKDFSGELEFDKNHLSIAGDVELMGGTAVIEGDAYIKKEPYLIANITCKDLEVHEFFRQCDNFGQKVITDNNLSGHANSKMAIKAFWDENGTFLSDKLHVYAGLNIKNGELANCKMLEAFSSFIKMQDLKRVKFVTMENWLEVKNRKVILPVMQIQSNAVNLSLNGEHTFDNRINYNVKVNVGQVLLRKLQNHDPNLSPQPAQDGWFNMYYNIVGTFDKYDMRMARKEIKADFERSEYQKQQIQNALNVEFMESEKNNLPNNEPKPVPTTKESIVYRVGNLFKNNNKSTPNTTGLPNKKKAKSKSDEDELIEGF